MTDYNYFREQIDLFVKALKEYDKSVWFPPIRGNYDPDVKSNWFIPFVPEVWGYWKTINYGVHFDLIYAVAKGNLPKRFRLTIGVENPFIEKYRQSFKEEVITRVRTNRIDTTGFLLEAENRKKLLEANPIRCDQEAWKAALERYKSLKPVINLIGEVSREYYQKGAFNTHIEFR